MYNATEQFAELNKTNVAQITKLAALSIRGIDIVVPDSSHYIQYDQPQAVIDAVKRALADIRGQ